MLEALRIARGLRRPACIWCDCQGVVDWVVRLWRGLVRIKPNGRPADLWGDISALLGDMDCSNVAVHQEHSCRPLPLKLGVISITVWLTMRRGSPMKCAHIDSGNCIQPL